MSAFNLPLRAAWVGKRVEIRNSKNDLIQVMPLKLLPLAFTMVAAFNSYAKLSDPLAAAETDLLGEALKALTEIIEGAVPAKRDWHMTHYAKLLAEKVLAKAKCS